MLEVIGKTDGENRKIGIVVSRFNEVITRRLLDGALRQLKQSGIDADNVVVCWVPGAFEIPRTAKVLGDSGKVDGIIALGAVIKGETSHYDLVCEAAANGIAKVSVSGKVPVMFGVVTTNNMEQAINRAGGKAGNKGSECANDILEVLSIEDAIS